MSRLIVALCVVGCLYAVQAKPHIGKLGGETKGFDAVPTDMLLKGTYHRLSTLLDTFTTDDVAALRKCLSTFVIYTHKRLFDNGFDVDYEQTIEKLRIEVDEMTLERLVEFARELHIKVLDSSRLSETEVKKTRAILTKFLNDPTPDIKYYIQHSWCTLYDGYTAIEKPIDTKEASFLELFTEVVRKLYTLRDSIWSTKKIELTNMVVKIIKRADEELVKCGGIEKVEKMLERRSYESLSTLPYYKLVSELYARFEGLFECVYKDETATVKTNLTKLLENIDELIVNQPTNYYAIMV